MYFWEIGYEIPDYIFFRTPFAFFDFEKPAALVFLENLAILSAFAFSGALLAALLKRKKGKEPAEEAPPGRFQTE